MKMHEAGTYDSTRNPQPTALSLVHWKLLPDLMVHFQHLPYFFNGCRTIAKTDFSQLFPSTIHIRNECATGRFRTSIFSRNSSNVSSNLAGHRKHVFLFGPFNYRKSKLQVGSLPQRRYICLFCFATRLQSRLLHYQSSTNSMKYDSN